jgi:uncharacterized membrane protein YbhN (UPF0104 family)
VTPGNDVSQDFPDAPDRDRIGPDQTVVVTEHRRLTFVPARIFSSAADAPRARRPTDWLLLIGSLLGLLLVTIPAPGPTVLDTATQNFIQSLPGLFGWFWEIWYDLLIGWALVVLILPLVRPKRRRLLVDLLLALALATALMLLAGRAAGTDYATTLKALFSSSAPPVYVMARLALSVAVVVTASPHLARPFRFVGRAVLLFGAIAGVALGAALPVGAMGAFLVGLLAAAIVHLALGSPGGRLTPDEVSIALQDLGIDVDSISDAPLQPRGFSLLTATQSDGARLLVKVYGRDAWDGQFLTSAWSSLWTKGETLQLGVGRLPQVEHEAFLTLLAQRAGVSVMPVVTAGMAGDDDAFLVTDGNARTLSALSSGDDRAAVTDEVLDQLWTAMSRLHGLGVAHGAVDGYRLVLRDDGVPALTDLSQAGIAASRNDLMEDRAQLIVTTALATDPERAIAAALRALGNPGLGEVLPYLQPAVLDRGTRRAVRQGEWTLDALRANAAQTAGTESPELEKLRRVSWHSVIVVVLIGVIAYTLISMLAGVNLQQLVDELKSADLVWLLCALVVSPLIQIPQAFSTIGACIKRIRYLPVLMLEYAIQFVALAVPSSAARVALEIRFFEGFGLGPAGATSVGIIDSVTGFAVQIAFILIITLSGLASLNLGSSASSSSDSSSTSTDSGVSHPVVIVAIVLLILGVIIAIAVPRYRRMIKEAVPRYRAAIRNQASEAAAELAVLRRPGKVLLMVGGNLTVQIMQALVLGICLKAFGYEAELAQLILINTFVSLFAGFMPVPGGMGVAEAGYTAGLEAIGIPSSAAISTAIAFRLVTFYLPPLWGAPAMAWLRRHEYV